MMRRNTDRGPLTGAGRNARPRPGRAVMFALAMSWAACLATPHAPARAQSKALGQEGGGAACFTGDLQVTASLKLKPGCRYVGSVTVVADDVTLDCGGAVLDGNGAAFAVLRVGWTKPVQRVVVRNCVIQGSRGDGLFVGLQAPDTDKLKEPDREARYAQVPRRVLIENVTITGSVRSGLYIDDYSSGVTVRHSRIVGNAGVGIYLEHSSRGNVVEDNVIDGNGRGRDAVPTAEIGTREGVAVDSSAANIIRRNEIKGNPLGGIFLYRNCGEQPSNPAQVLRWQPAQGNRIEGNRIQGGLAGIWVASRQDRGYDPSACRLRPDPARHVFDDDAPGNQVLDNVIVGTDRGIVVEDDRNVVVGNTIVAARRDCIEAGSEKRTSVYHAPVVGLRIARNSCRPAAGAGGGEAVKIVPGTDVQGGGNVVVRGLP